LFSMLEVENDNYKNYFFITLGVLGIVIVGFSISLMLSGKKNKHKSNFK